MMYLRSCPRCGGDLQEESDKFGPYIACIQCGNHLTGREEVVVASSTAAMRRKRSGRQFGVRAWPPVSRLESGHSRVLDAAGL
jgi:DNA-directed RNA polymerase subunit RPC12/RpoP